MLKLNAPAEIHWRRSNMNKRGPILMKSVEVLKDCRSLNAADEMNCSMPRSVEKVPVRNEKRCSETHQPNDKQEKIKMCKTCDIVWPNDWSLSTFNPTVDKYQLENDDQYQKKNESGWCPKKGAQQPSLT